jgi:Tfp pilus assembly protein PilO
MPRENFFRALWRQSRTGVLVVGVLLLINLAGWLIVSRVVAPQVEAARKALSREQDRLRQQKAGELPAQSGSAYRQGRREFEEFQNTLLPKKELTLFLGEIYSLAKEANLGIDRIRFHPEPVAEQGLLRYTLDFSVSGDYPQIKTFIQSLENSGRIIILDKMSLSGEQAEKDRVALGLQLTTYFKSGDR